MLKHVLGQSATAQLLVAPLVEGHVDVCDGAPERRAVLSGERAQILLPRSRQLIGLADVLQGIKQDGGDYLRNILCGDRRGTPRTEG